MLVSIVLMKHVCNLVCFVGNKQHFLCILQIYFSFCTFYRLFAAKVLLLYAAVLVRNA